MIKFGYDRIGGSMQCYNCKTDLPENATFCSSCGSMQVRDPVNVPNNQASMNATVSNTKKVKPKKKKKHRFLRFLLFLVLVFLGIRAFNRYKQTLDQIYLSHANDDGFYEVGDSLKQLDLNIRTFKRVKSTTIKIYSRQLVLFEKKYDGQKKWVIDNISLPIGSSDLDVQVELKNGEKIERHFLLYNTHESNLGTLEITDTDQDLLLDYQEDMFGTDRNNQDSDFDGLTDYQEVFLVNSSPVNPFTFDSQTRDADNDFDGDQLTNLEELEFGTNPLLEDSDSDGLNDYQEIKTYYTNANESDSDQDGVSDYQEIHNYHTDALSKTEIFSGKVESNNRDVSITLNNLSVSDIQSVVFEQSENPLFSYNIVGYIMPAYDIFTDIPFSSSTLSFDFKEYSLENDAQPTIYYYNEETNLLEEMPTTIVGTTASTIVEHFSTYILIDKNQLSAINQVDVNSTTIDVERKISGEFTFFFSPLLAQFAKVPIEVYAGPSISEEDAEILSLKIKYIMGDNYLVRVKTIRGKAGFNVLRKIIDSTYDVLYFLFKDLELEDLLETEQINETSYIHSIGGETLLIGYIQNVDDLTKSSLGGEGTMNDIVAVKLNELDSNNDGISDGLTTAIISGAITTQTGINPFEGCSFADIQASRDYDEDGIINGDEIKVEGQDGKYYIHMLSNPSKKDSDDDGLDDNDDASPLLPLMRGFTIGTSLKEGYDTSKMDAEIAKTNQLFGTGNYQFDDYIEYELDGETKRSPHLAMEVLSGAAMGLGAMVGDLVNAGDARRGLHHYLSCDGNPYTEKDLVVPTFNEDSSLNLNSILGSEDVQWAIKDQIKKLQHGAEENIKNGDTRVIKSSKTFQASIIKGKESNSNVTYFLHGSSGYIVSEVSNQNGIYHTKIRFFILDKYDWKNSEECDVKNPACATEVFYFNKLLLGEGKVYLVNIEYDMDVSWKKGEEAVITFYDDVRYS